jgi:hypothetical protein
MSLANLPEIQTVLKPVTRWTHARKFWLAVAVDEKIISFEEACALHEISAEELTRWIELGIGHGSEALKSMHVQQDRVSP